VLGLPDQIAACLFDLDGVRSCIDHLFEAVIDGRVAQRDHLPGKPAPDLFLLAAA